MSEYVADVIAVLDDAGADRAALVGYSAGAAVADAVAGRHPGRVGSVAGIGVVGAPDEDDGDLAARAAAIRADDMRAAMEQIAAEEPQRPPGWLMDNLAGTAAEMFALLVEAWAGEPGSWAGFPAIQAPGLIICDENEEPHAARHARPAAQTLPRPLGRGPARAVPPPSVLAHRPVMPAAHRIRPRALDSAAAAGVTCETGPRHLASPE